MRLAQWDGPTLEGTIQQHLLDFLRESGGLVTGDPGHFLDQLQVEFVRRGVHIGTLSLYNALCRLRAKKHGDDDGIWFVKNGTNYSRLSGFCLRDRNLDYSEARYLGQYKVS